MKKPRPKPSRQVHAARAATAGKALSTLLPETIGVRAQLRSALSPSSHARSAHVRKRRKASHFFQLAESGNTGLIVVDPERKTDVFGRPLKFTSCAFPLISARPCPWRSVADASVGGRHGANLLSLYGQRSGEL